MPGPMLIASGGVVLAAAAIGMLFLAVFCGDMFLKTDKALRRWMDAIMWCLTGGLLLSASCAAWTIYKFHP